MFLYHLWLLLGKSLRYAWRRRTCRCCPKILFELLIPLLCLLFLILIRWIHTPSDRSTNSLNNEEIKPNRISLTPVSIHDAEPSQEILRYPLLNRCPSDKVVTQIVNQSLAKSLEKKCPSSQWTKSRYEAHFILNQSTLFYRCRFNNQKLCQNQSDSSTHYLHHPSVSLCASSVFFDEEKDLLNSYLSLQSMIFPSKGKTEWRIFSWPCPSYLSDPLFQLAPGFVLGMILLFIDGCVLFGFNSLVHALLDEKSQGITELLRLISVQPILNSLSWFIRSYLVQLIPTIALIVILKISVDGGIYLAHVSIWLIIPSLLFWTAQVFSRAVLVGHFFVSHLKATLWSWFIYFISFWLAFTSMIHLPYFLHLFLSAWLPFYSIKRLFIFLFRLNTDQGRSSALIGEIISIWCCMLVGSLIMWFLAYYLDQVRPGKYGIPRRWSWPWTDRRIRQSKRRESIDMNMVETLPEENTTVRVNNLTKTYGPRNAERQVAVDRISFKLEKSKIHGLIGHNGAGKTTTMEMLCGLLSCDCGTIEIHDRDLYDHLIELQTCLGYCPQHDMLFSHLTVAEQLEFYANVRSHGKKRISSEQIDEFLTMMEMKEHRNQLCHRLSGGMQRKLSILCAFVGEANVILLDEPSSSLDPLARRMLWSWLREHKTNRTLLISSHLLDEVEELCDSVIILDSGKVRAQGTVLELKRQFGPPGDRLHLHRIPDYVPTEWIFDQTKSIIQVPNRKDFIHLLERLERDQIKYSLDNITLDDIFLHLTSTSDTGLNDDATAKSQIESLFAARTKSNRSELYSQQILGVLIRRGQVFLRRARLLPIVIFLFLLYAFAPLYMPSFSLMDSTRSVRYIISAPASMIDQLPLKKEEYKISPIVRTTEQFQESLLRMNVWPSDYQPKRIFVGLRVMETNQWECYVPSPHLNIILSYCLPILNALNNQTVLPFRFLSRNFSQSLFPNPALNMWKSSPLYFCYYTLPPTLHFSIILLFLILLICAALTIQDHSSGLHSYSLIHGLRSPIHWFVTYLSDLILCLLWLLMLILIARFAHSESFHGRFFALTPLFFIVTLPFIYLIARCFHAPILGATTIIFLLLIAHALNTFKIIIEFFRAYRTLSLVIHVIRWLLILLFPNVNAYTLIVAILRPYACKYSNTFSDNDEEFSHERYPHKVLIHSGIYFLQWLIYFLLLIVVDTWRNPFRFRSIKDPINEQEEDNDVKEERERIETMPEDDRAKEALVVENLSKRYARSDRLAVNRLTFSVSHRQCFGLLGFNGSGKTTTFRMLVGELAPSAGHVYSNTDDTLGYCPQDDIHFSALTVSQSINYICRLHGLNPERLNTLILRQFQLEKSRNRLVSHLSGGTRRRLHLALCLIGSPTLLLLDEPTAKVDPVLRGHIRLILQHRPIDTSIVFASHSMLECEQLCDRLTILVRGTARCLGSPRHLKEKYGSDYRVRLTQQPGREHEIPSILKRLDNSDEYLYPKDSLARLFHLLEDLVQRNIIQSNYTVQLTSLEHIFLAFQHL